LCLKNGTLPNQNTVFLQKKTYNIYVWVKWVKIKYFMALETNVITDELKNQGISETLATGLSFETTEDLSSWVEAYKTAIPKAKEIQDYTKEEIEAIAKDPQFKGAKGLQGYSDSLRQKPNPKPDDKTPLPNDKPDFAALIAEAQKPLLAQLEALTTQKQAESFESQVRKSAKDAGITDDELIQDIRESLQPTATPEEIKAKIDKKKAWMAKVGIKNFGTPGGGGGDNKGELESAMKEWNKKQDSKKK